MHMSEPIIVDENGCWSVMVRSTSTSVQKYECGSEKMARKFAALFLTPARARPEKCASLQKETERLPWFTKRGGAR